MIEAQSFLKMMLIESYYAQPTGSDEWNVHRNVNPPMYVLLSIDHLDI